MNRERKLNEFVDRLIQDEIHKIYRDVYGKGFFVGFVTALVGAMVFYAITTGA
ncbi:MAG: hypothetical protein LUP97_09350 [Methanoregula sp.]|jgi:hypothetical protein|nr:hypothetical protein [Methanoregula sp.]